MRETARFGLAGGGGGNGSKSKMIDMDKNSTGNFYHFPAKRPKEKTAGSCYGTVYV
jgi:hypothetical protein